MHRAKTKRPTAPPRKRLSAAELVRDGNLLRGADKYAPAEEAYGRAIRVDPKCADAWAELGCLLADSRRFHEASHCFRRALEIPRGAAGAPDGEAANALREAVRLLQKIAAVRPAWGRGHFSLGCMYEQLGEHGPARAHLADALRLEPPLAARLQSMFARMNWLEGKLADAIANADRALAADPENLLAHVVRSSCCAPLGRMAEAVDHVRRAVEIAAHPTLHSSVVFGMNFLPETTPEALYAEACRWDSLYAAPLARHIRPHTNRPDAGRRLKVGYVSPDLINHAMMKFLPPVLEHHDRSQVEAFVYAVGSRSDHVTGELRRSIDNFVPFPGEARELADRIRADGIDILVDLAGHTMEAEYLLAFARRPAPIQVTWMGMICTTGLSAMDYFLCDAHFPCPGTEHLFSEILYRLPRVSYCYRPFADVPIAPAPCLERGHITFGSFNSPRKINREVVKLWSAVLHAVPGSRLLLKYGGMENQALQDRLLAWFLEDGVARGCVEFAEASPALEYLAAFGGIDVALDTFPYNGGSTTLDTLWMGVPVVTLAGRLAVQRAGASVLTAAGMSDCVARTPEEYLRAAVFLAGAVPRIPDLRRNLRQALRASPLMDEIGLVRTVEAAFRDMWRAWCRR